MSQNIKVIRYAPEQLHYEFQELLNHFAAQSQSETILRLLGKDLLKEIRLKSNQIQKRLNQEFSLVVAGEFKRGKSTFINALLKTDVVTTNITPETVTINEIEYGSELKINACLTDGGLVGLEHEELYAEKLRLILAQYPNQISHLNIETPVEYLQGLRLVDTPGTGDIFKQFDSQIHTYLSQADMVLWVISALSPLSESEQAFLRLSLAPQNFPKLFFIVNMMDCVHTKAEAERLLYATRKKISVLFPDAHVFGVSALDEFCRNKSLPRPNMDLASILESSFQSLRDSLQKSILLNKDLIQIERAAVQMTQLVQRFESRIVLIRDAMQADKLCLKDAIKHCEKNTSELYTQIEKHKQEMREEISKLCEQTRNWMNEFIERLETEAIACISDFHLDKVRSHFHFFLTDKLRQAIQQCLNTHQPAIIKIANKTKISIFEDFHQLTNISITGVDLAAVTSVTLQDVPWANLDTLNLLTYVIGVDEIVQLLTSLFIHQKNESEKSDHTINYRQQLQEYLPELKDSILQKVGETYAQISTKIEKEIEQAYQQEIAASLAAMKQAQQLSISGEENITTANEEVQVAMSLVKDTRSELQSFRDKLRVRT